MPRRNCFCLPVTAARATAKCSGAKSGMRGKATFSSAKSVSPTRRALALTRPMTSPGKASSSVERSRPKTLCAYFVAKGLPVSACVTTMPRVKRPEQTRTKARRSRWARSMPAWILKTNPEKGADTSRGVPDRSGRAPGAGASVTSVSSSWRTPKLSTAEPKRTGDAAPERKSSWS